MSLERKKKHEQDIKDFIELVDIIKRPWTDVIEDGHVPLFNKFYRWLGPKGKALFTYATKEFTGSNKFDGYIEFMGRELYYSHKSPEELYAHLEEIGFNIESTDYRDIGNEIFLWVTVSKPM